MPTFKNTTILGIDPGFAITGWGVLEKKQQNIKTVGWGTIKTSKQSAFPDRLQILARELTKLIKKYQPNILAIEDLFFYNNAKTAIKVGEARGAIVLTATNNSLPVINYTPLQIKQAVTSYGRAEKKQMQKMIKTILKLKQLPQPDDAADALAVAYCCAQSLNSWHAHQ